jgi:hypothetical protein
MSLEPPGERRDADAILAGAHPDQALQRIPAPRREDQCATAVEPAVRTTAEAFAQAVASAAAAAARTRRDRNEAADLAAVAVAREAARTARRVQIRADVAAAQVQHAAAIALEGLGEDGPGDGRAAAQMAGTVEAAALATAEDTAVAARVVASAVTAAAANVARMVLVSDEAFALEVARAAEALQELTTLMTEGRSQGVAT